MDPRPAVFLDRDGTLIEERHYPTEPEDIVPVRGVGEALARLATAGYLRIILTNQSAVARGMISEEELAALNRDLADKLAVVGGGFDALYYCPHHPDGIAMGYAVPCRCRKPDTGLLDLARSRHEIDLSRSAFIGDSPRDLFPTVEGVGARILVRTGHPVTDRGAADHVAPTVVEAIDWLLTRAARRAARREGAAPPRVRARGA